MTLALYKFDSFNYASGSLGYDVHREMEEAGKGGMDDLEVFVAGDSQEAEYAQAVRSETKGFDQSYSDFLGLISVANS